MNQVTHAFRNRVANDPINLEVFALIINSVNILENICWYLSRRAFLSCFQTTKSEKSSVQRRKHSANLSHISHTKSYQFFIFLFGTFKKLEHL